MSPKNRDVFVPSGYPKLKRLPVGPRLRGKAETYARPEDLRTTFSGRVIVEEKMDGSTAMRKTNGNEFIIFAEDLKVCHSIRYKIPARYAIFDVFDMRKKRFLCREGKEDVFAAIRRSTLKIEGESPYNFFIVPVVFAGKTELSQIPSLIGISAFAVDENGKPALMEGVVVKPDRELFLVELEDRAGKLVRKEFAEGIEVHYRSRKIKYNIIDPRIVWLGQSKPDLFPESSYSNVLQ